MELQAIVSIWDDYPFRGPIRLYQGLGPKLKTPVHVIFISRIACLSFGYSYFVFLARILKYMYTCVLQFLMGIILRCSFYISIPCQNECKNFKKSCKEHKLPFTSIVQRCLIKNLIGFMIIHVTCTG